MFIFNKSEVYFGFSIKDQAEIKDILSCEHIPYQTKVEDLAAKWMTHGTTRGNFSNFLANSGIEKQYHVYVKRSDFDKAKQLIDSRPLN